MVEIVRHIKPVIGRVERCVGKLSYGRKASCDGLCVIWTQHRAQHGILMNQDLLEEIKALKRIAQLSPSISSSTKAKKKVFTLDNKYFVRTVMSALVLSIIFFLWAKSKTVKVKKINPSARTAIFQAVDRCSVYVSNQFVDQGLLRTCEVANREFENCSASTCSLERLHFILTRYNFNLPPLYQD